jgi:hypothetical protein
MIYFNHSKQRLCFLEEVGLDIDSPIIGFIHHLSELTSKDAKRHSPSKKQNKPDVINYPLHENANRKMR